MPSNLKIYTVQPNYVTSAGVAVTVRGAAFDSGSYVIFDGPNGTSIQPTSFSNSSLTFDMPQSTVGVHHIQIGEMSSNLPISPAYNVVMGENTVGSSPAPTARLTVNGLHARVLNVGDTIQLVWNAANADEYTSELASGGPSTCSSLPLSIQSAQGSLQYTIPEAYASCVWRLTFLAKNNTLGYQAAASDSVILYVRSLMRPAMAASNSSAH
ncbi:MAG: IPT/TIG domain-containing protein [Patescibacteria group bacterium]|nr:IPT/TIG domain-containing protein [Patescibacteria group bacterium]